MKRIATYALALLAVACRSPLPGADVHDDEESDGSSSTSSTSTSSETSTSESDDTGETGGTTGFVPDLVEPPVDCDPISQNCPDGEKCVVYSSNGGGFDDHKCVPVLGDQAPGEPCIYGGTTEATDDCDETSACWDVQTVDEQAVGVCRAFCTGTPDEPECPITHSCLVGSDLGAYVCVPDCDPIYQTCNEGLACYWVVEEFNCLFTTLNIPTGEPCADIDECAAGNVCVAAEELPSCAGESCCSPWCALEQGDVQCAAIPGTTCEPFFEEGAAKPGYENVGVCTVPP